MNVYGEMYRDVYRETYGVCRLCRATQPDGAPVQVTRCLQCGVPLAIARDHVEWNEVDDTLRDEAKRLLLEVADEMRLTGMFSDTADSSSMTQHYRAHWRPIAQPIKRFPQVLADAMAKETQEAVQWFHDRDHAFYGDPGVRAIPDDEVAERIAGMQFAMDKEIYQTIARAGTIEGIIDPETMEGYERFLRWYAEEHKPESDRRAGEAGSATYGYPVLRYDLSAMPPERQRALVERWERSHRTFLADHPDINYHPEVGYLTTPYRIYGPPETGEVWGSWTTYLGYPPGWSL